MIVELITHWISVTVKVIAVVQDVERVELAVEVVLGTTWVLFSKETSTERYFIVAYRRPTCIRLAQGHQLCKGP